MAVSQVRHAQETGGQLARGMPHSYLSISPSCLSSSSLKPMQPPSERWQEEAMLERRSWSATHPIRPHAAPPALPAH